MSADATAAPATPASVSFVDTAGAPDAAMAALDAVLGEGAQGDTDATATGSEQAGSAAVVAPSGAAAVEAKPDGEPKTPEGDEGAQLRKGFSKLADERQKLLTLQGQARAELAQAQQWKEDAEAFKAFREDPGEFALAKLSAEQVNKLLETIAARADKSPAERRLDEIEARQAKERDEAAQQAQVRKVQEWRDSVTKAVTDAGEKYDLVNSLGLHGDVIDVMTKYYEKHSVRDEKGNVVEPAILPWDAAADAVESTRAERIKNSKKYGPRAPAATPPATAAPMKDAASEGKPPAPKRSGTPTLSSVPVAETPVSASELSKNNDERERQILAELGF